jgi:6-pyruvoyltetrahydropterin/6-carboxytetrahydropterin synthase
MITLTRRYRFSASHRLHSCGLSDARNAVLYGKCNNPYGHGHDYILEVTAAGDVDETTGLLLPVAQLDQLVAEKVLRLFAFRYINMDVPAFQTRVPTTENVALFISDLVESSWRDYIRQPGVHLRRVHLQETDRNGFEVMLRTAERDRMKRAERESVLTAG